MTKPCFLSASQLLRVPPDRARSSAPPRRPPQAVGFDRAAAHEAYTRGERVVSADVRDGGVTHIFFNSPNDRQASRSSFSLPASAHAASFTISTGGFFSATTPATASSVGASSSSSRISSQDPRPHSSAGLCSTLRARCSSSSSSSACCSRPSRPSSPAPATPPPPPPPNRRRHRLPAQARAPL